MNFEHFLPPATPLSADLTSVRPSFGPGAPPARLTSTPVAPISKSTFVGHIADWSNPTKQRPHARQDGGDEEDAFFTVDYTTQKNLPKQFNKNKANRGNMRRFPVAAPAITRSRQYAKHLASGQARKRGGFKGIGRTAHAPQYSNTGQQQGGNYNNHYGNNNNNNRFGGGSPDVPKASLVVQDDWTLVDQWTAMAMQKLPGGSAAGEDIELRGQVRPYVKAVERTAAAAPVPVQATTRAFLRVTTTEDPVLQQLAMSGKDQLYATDQVLTHLMTAGRSGQSWDIIVTKIAGKIFLDKRDGSPVDLVSVNENDAEPPKAEDGELAPHVLSAEATLVNQKFSQHVVDAKGAPAQLGETPELFEEALEDGAQPVDVAYRYRRFRLNDGTSIVVRCEVDAYQGTPAAPKFATVRALNEYKIGAASDWRHKLDSSKGSVMAAELKSNNAKLVRWTAQALLAGNELLTIGFVSRLRSRTADQHVLLGVQTYGTADFAKQTGSSLNNLWGIVQKVVASLSKKENGKYVLLLVPGTKALALYSVPLNTFEPEDAADEDDAAAAADGDERGIRNAGNVGDVRLAGSDDEDDDGDAK